MEDLGEWVIVETTYDDGRVVYSVEQEHGLVLSWDSGGKWETRSLRRARRMREKMRSEDRAIQTTRRRVVK